MSVRSNDTSRAAEQVTKVADRSHRAKVAATSGRPELVRSSLGPFQIGTYELCIGLADVNRGAGQERKSRLSTPRDQNRARIPTRTPSGPRTR